eukprot:2371108-Prymnesium_polylepis.1
MGRLTRGLCSGTAHLTVLAVPLSSAVARLILGLGNDAVEGPQARGIQRAVVEPPRQRDRQQRWA